MKVLWIFAHPEPRSLNGALRDEGIRTLTELGHDHRQSDLYAMNWNPVVTGADFAHEPADRLVVGSASRQALENQTLSPDIRLEQEKIDWADAVIVHFPLWWYGMPAILKGWFDRVFVKGFGYGVSSPGPDRRTLRYGEGRLAGKRAMLITSAGSGEPALGPRGVNGDIGELLFPIQHGTLWYAGLSVLPPLVVYGADRFSETAYDNARTDLRERLRTLPTAAPIPFRRQNHGDYEDLVLRPELAPGRSGLRIHQTN
ncbi:NAD(P)H dehydrogenase (quinone) [Actinoalloteichus hoggarensis]|uniref:General stress protein 14 n=1 Tax=Actinoalloteichus hoggarensis TaxID=1470176 RepID=A0A221W3U1_9PSEU|nr:NAD(P)H-dependent oxidoreductase [Actinoalloteichus hoggarensis]ASO20540.1 General stress protein 14 [Actinoalloteichus hoggarensis]MBB5923580.1 NAD(P)H dehydrogenase (quinone) [Actinoalloteichus hoggarensis]